MAIEGKNSDLYRRFRLYGFGFLIGMLMVSMLYKGKGCQMPNSAKLEELSYQHIEYTKKADCIMKCRNITDAEIKQVMKSGKVNYTLSDVHHKPYPTYTIEGPTGTKRNLRIVIDDVDSISKVLTTTDLLFEKDNCNCK